jgi:hypothetical protein
MGRIAILDHFEYEYEYRDAEYEYEKNHEQSARSSLSDLRKVFSSHWGNSVVRWMQGVQ